MILVARVYADQLCALSVVFFAFQASLVPWYEKLNGCLHPAKALFPILVIDVGIDTEFMFGHWLNASEPTVETLVPRVTFEIEVSSKALSPIEVTLLPKTRAPVTPEQRKKAWFPMVVTVLGRLRLVRPEYANAPFPIVRSPAGSETLYTLFLPLIYNA